MAKSWMDDFKAPPVKGADASGFQSKVNITLAEKLGPSVDPRIAYLTSNGVASDLAHAWARMQDATPHEKAHLHRLTTRGAGRPRKAQPRKATRSEVVHAEMNDLHQYLEFMRRDYPALTEASLVHAWYTATAKTQGLTLRQFIAKAATRARTEHGFLRAKQVQLSHWRSRVEKTRRK